MSARHSAASQLVAWLLAACVWVFGAPIPRAHAGPAEPESEAASESDGGSEQDPAAAEPPARESVGRAAILPLEVVGELSGADRETLTTALVDGLERGSFDIVEPAEVAKKSPAAKRCKKADCYKRVAKANDATHVVRAQVTIEDRDYTVRVELIDGVRGVQLASSSEGCEICGIVDAGNLMGTAAATLRTKLDALARGPATLSVTSSPSGAEVTLDGEIIGTTPLEQPVVPGKRVLRISKDGFITIEREVTFVEAVQESVNFDLDKVPSRLPSRPWGWVSLGVGIAAVGTSVAFAVLDLTDTPLRVGGRCSEDKQDPMGNCPEIWDAEFIILPTALIGATLTTLGVAILLNSAKRRGKKRSPRARAKKKKKNKKSARRPTRPRVGIGFGSVRVSGRF